MYVFIYIYTHIYVYLYVYTYIYIHAYIIFTHPVLSTCEEIHLLPVKIKDLPAVTSPTLFPGPSCS